MQIIISMKKIFLLSLLCFMSISCVLAADVTKMLTGKCGKDVNWSFDGYTLTITRKENKFDRVAIDNYNLSKVAPWVKKGLNVRRVRVGEGIVRIGSCAFANCADLLDLEFETSEIEEIGWGAFYNCTNLRNISLPPSLAKIETIAFANCRSLPSVTVPEHCRLEDQAFVSCSGLKQISVGLTTIMGNACFAKEEKVGNRYVHVPLDAEIKQMPVYVTAQNGTHYGLSESSVERYVGRQSVEGPSYDAATSDVDVNIPATMDVRNDTYALIIGNQNYRFVPEVPYAIHDAHVFAEYCKLTLGIPSFNIHVCDDATKSMIQDQEMEWLNSITDRESKTLFLYYSGHGVPDTREQNKAYLLPTDVMGTSPHHGIALEKLYAQLGSMGFRQVNVMMDACFSGMNRNNVAVVEGSHSVGVVVDEPLVKQDNVVVFSAAQGNEVAQANVEQGHGLFTYYLLQELRANRPMNFWGTFSENVIRNVENHAKSTTGHKSQTPVVNTSKEKKVWEKLPL